MIAFLFTFITGFLFIRTFLSDVKSKFLIISLSIAFGIALESFLVSLLMYLGICNTFSCLFSVLALLFLSIFYAYKKKIVLSFDKSEKCNKILSLTFIIVFILNMLLVAIRISKEPQGAWDGMFIWNLHTKFFYILLNNSQDWKLFFNDTLSMYHPDYPLLLPFYNLKNQILNFSGYSNIIPLITSFLFYIGVLTGVMGFLQEVANKKTALIAGIVLMSQKIFIWEGVSQYADIPLSLYILSSFGCLFLFDKYKHNIYIFFAFFFAASAAFCKNEGILFLLIFSVIFALFMRNISKKAVILGCLLPLFCLLYFKIFIYSKSDLFQNLNLTLFISKILNVTKIQNILENNLYNLVNSWNIVIITILILIFGYKKINKLQIMIFLTLVAVFLGYMVIYLISPYDIGWHLATSSIRVMAQYLPLFVFLIFTIFGNTKNNLI